jgi:hypothetical protein
MDVINSRTELYDLFGESVFCSVCQEDVQEGERVRVIHSCQHGFHATCIEPWLLNKGTCALCRAPIDVRLQHVSNRLRTIIQNNPGFSVDDFLSQVETVAQQTAIESPENVLKRYILAYCLAYGILRKFRTAGPYRENANAIRITLANFQFESVRPYPLDSSTRASLRRSQNLMRGEIIRRLGSQENSRNFRIIPQISSLLYRVSLVTGDLHGVWSL